MSEHPEVADQFALAEEELTSCLTRLGQESLDPITQERARDNADEAFACVRWLKTAFASAVSTARAEGRKEGFERARGVAQVDMEKRSVAADEFGHHSTADVWRNAASIIRAMRDGEVAPRKELAPTARCSCGHLGAGHEDEGLGIWWCTHCRCDGFRHQATP